MLASSGETYSLGPLFLLGPASILRVELLAGGGVGVSSEVSPPPILINTTHSIIKRVPIQSFSDNF